ncbi:mechanosensitive ion channel family protein [Flavobacterium ponti]|jgi:small conductance mechanosensitive channel|uniref:Mechanosensitive ion channel family protein n=1 Tax=Flavobacterium ponti TaxID=665133 RepID=A0ABV9P3J6_9FLAO
MSEKEITTYFEYIKNYVLEYSPKLISAILILFIGLWATSIITKLIKRLMRKREIEATLILFIGNLVFWALRILVLVTVITQLGIGTSSFVAILGAAGLAVGLALQGSLSNFAGGVLIILLKPFRVGDVIEAQGLVGTVKEIKMFSTYITLPENKLAIIPNAALSNDKIINFTVNGNLRVDIEIGVDYGSNFKQVKEVVFNILNNHPLILKEPAPSVFVKTLNNSSVDFAIRPWSTAADYWTVRAEVIESCKLAFDEAGIEIPYPHQVEIRKVVKEN